MNQSLFLIFHGRFPSEKAASLFAAKSAEAFADKGVIVELLVPKRKEVSAEEAFSYYGIKRNFSVRELPTVDFFGGPLKKIAFWASYVAFSLSCLKYLKDNAGPDDIIYSNETLPLWVSARACPNTFYEMHDFPESKLGLFARFLKRARWILVHNKWKLGKLRETFLIPESKLLYEPNAVDISAFDPKVTQKEAREKLSLSLDNKLVVYTGHLYGWKGVDALAKAASKLPHDIFVAFIGGTEKDIASFRAKYGKEANIIIVGHRPHKEIPLWQRAADVLVLPNTAKEAISAHYTSPMKLFEYMASRKPIVASDIPSIREILDGDSAFLVSPDDEVALADAITLALGDKAGAEARAAKAFDSVREHTWEKRAERILDFMRYHA